MKQYGRWRGVSPWLSQERTHMEGSSERLQRKALMTGAAEPRWAEGTGGCHEKGGEAGDNEDGGLA